jgi:hypothetical protein
LVLCCPQVSGSGPHLRADAHKIDPSYYFIPGAYREGERAHQLLKVIQVPLDLWQGRPKGLRGQLGLSTELLRFSQGIVDFWMLPYVLQHLCRIQVLLEWYGLAGPALGILSEQFEPVIAKLVASGG